MQSKDTIMKKLLIMYISGKEFILIVYKNVSTHEKRGK